MKNSGAALIGRMVCWIERGKLYTGHIADYYPGEHLAYGVKSADYPGGYRDLRRAQFALIDHRQFGALTQEAPDVD